MVVFLCYYSQTSAKQPSVTQSLKKGGRKLVKLLSKKGQTKFTKYCESISQNKRRRMQKRNLQTFCKTKYHRLRPPP